MRIDKTPEWQALKHHHNSIESMHLRGLFAGDTERSNRFTVSFDSLVFDYSKNRITNETLDLLINLAEAAGIIDQRAKMFDGAPINTTEQRAVLHTALRDRSDVPVIVEGNDVKPLINKERAKVYAFAEAVRSGEIKGHTGKRFTDVVNIGIGGSDLGPVMTTLALKPFHDGPNLHYVSNVDAAHLADTLASLDPETTLFLIASKTFTTTETMANARAAKKWVGKTLGDESVSDHFAALSTNHPGAIEFGIRPERIFVFWDWVGGRYSIWSAIGLPLVIAIGAKNFDAFLDGANAMDRHFQKAPLRVNIPLLMALLGVWYRNFFQFSSYGVMPYDQRLSRFPAYLQQLDMESNGKSVSHDGAAVGCDTGPLIWGEPGTNGQHAFFQLLHQGTEIVPLDFLVAANGFEADASQHEILVANCFAQSEALALGRTTDEAAEMLAAASMAPSEVERLAHHKAFPGNRPSNTLLYDKLDPHTLGLLIAAYEHKVFVQGVIWGVNSFDQMGVELGKELAKSLLPAVRSETKASSLSAHLVDLFKTKQD
jgi:glucose-6-phosphate isomerase